MNLTGRIVKGVRGWHVQLNGANHEIVLTSETYSTKWNAKRALKKMGVPEAPEKP